MAIPFFRLSSVLFKAYRKPKSGFLEQTEIETKVHLNDLDMNMHMNNARYATMFDLGRVDFLVKTGLMKHIWNDKWRPIVAATTITFLKSLKLYERFKVTTKLVYCDEKWFYLEHRLLRKNELYAVSYVKCLFLKLGKKIPSQELAQMLDVPIFPQMNPPQSLLKWIEAESAFKDSLD